MSHGVESMHTSAHTVCPRSSDSFSIVTYYMKWDTTSWTVGTSQLALCAVMFTRMCTIYLGSAYTVLNPFIYTDNLLISEDFSESKFRKYHMWFCSWSTRFC